ncbi:uncharacterized protein LOC130957751 [Arachis stenosperma]|uniref:uncharacterized protein LOC130957751 n=1 Tax=Arachis stenosperma TaxID=217475 RepID=UPI0025AD2E40|nr:uncharacterized protein LOC130957751 [Arachis stenosperma]
MVLGMKAKNRRSGSIQIDYLIHLKEIKPWPPTQSLRSLRSVLIQWKNGESSSGCTKLVSPSLGSVIGEGKIEFNESVKLSVTLLRDVAVRGGDADVFQKNLLDLNLYEPRREKSQLLASGTIDLANFVMHKERFEVTVPMNCKRSYRNTDPPLLFVKIQRVEKSRGSSSLKDRFSTEDCKERNNSNGGGSVSDLISEEYAEEAEIASFTDDDDDEHSSHSSEKNGADRQIYNTSMNEKKNSLASDASISHSLNLNSLSTQERVLARADSDSSSSSLVFSFDLNSKSRTRNSENENVGQNVHEKVAAGVQRKSKENASIIINSGNTLSEISSVYKGENPSYENCDNCESNEKLNGRYEKGDEQLVAQGPKDQVSFDSTKDSTDRLKILQLAQSPADSAWFGTNHYVEVKENGGLGDSRNNGGNGRKVYPKATRNGGLDGKMEHLEMKIKKLEGELREAAAIEAALYSVVAEHGNSMSKVHAPARRLSRLYLHACKENIQGTRSGAAKSSVSGLVLVVKACGNDVPRLTFWLSNTIVLRTIINQSIKDSVQSNNSGVIRGRKYNGDLYGKITSTAARLKGYHPAKNEHRAIGYASFGNWEDPQVFISALEKVEVWIFSRIVESIWWQTLTPHMQPIAAKLAQKEVNSASRKNKRGKSNSYEKEKGEGNLPLDIWKKAFKETCERLCPIRSAGHECGCLPIIHRLIMEQCVARLDVAMFNAILRKSYDEIPTDPLSDPITDPKVLPIPPGKSSFGAGAHLKTVIGTWSRWLTDLFGMEDDDDHPVKEKDDNEKNNEKQITSFKSFNLLNALSDLLMLPKDMLLSASVRKEVCPMFSATLIKKILDSFVPDEFCTDPVPPTVFDALNSESDTQEGNESVLNYPCIAAPIIYLPPPATSIASIVGDFGNKSQLRRSRSCVLSKSNTSDDELDELKCPLSSIFFFSGSLSSSQVSAKPNLKSKDESPVRYELLRDIWLNSE